MKRLAGKIALITGAASGIGYATAERFVAEGATLIIAGRGRERLAAAYGRLCGGDASHRTAHLDVTVEEGWVRIVEEIDSTYGRLDVLVNNAGSAQPRTIEAMTLGEWREIMAVNLDSVFLGTKYALPLLARSGHGSIINVSSIIGVVGLPESGSYSAAKGGVRMLTKVTALECAAAGNGVRANSVLPGQVETPLFGDPTEAGELLSRIPLGRIGQAREIAEAMVFLASDESSFMTGAELTLDGGYTAQ